MNERINELKIGNSKFHKVSNFFLEVYQSICKIIVPDNPHNILGTGFLMKLEKSNSPLLSLIIPNHIITQDMIDSKEILEVYYNKQNNKINICLDKNKRFIQDYIYIGINAIVIEILEEDNISQDFFLLPNLDYLKGYEQFKYDEINIINENKSSHVKFNVGMIININKDLNEFTYYSKKQFNFSGYPIFLKDSSKVLGILKNEMKDNEGKANFIGPIINSLRKNYICDKKIYDDKVYEGEFKDNKREGFGKYYLINHWTYFGQWKDDKINGKGKLYDKNNNLIYEGEFVNNKFEGNGTYYFQDGSFYCGQLLDNKKHGKGIIYYENGKIKYDGEFVNDKFEGSGTFFYEDDMYYIGKFSNDKKNGNGILYNKDGNIQYIGDFKDDKFEGSGKYVYKDGSFYIGEWSNNKRNGKGKLYNNKNSVIIEGNFVDDKFICNIF